ncbi:carboxylesterase/lipase family protein [Flavisphingomonas formosensis]|uniref:carboxylesterase/lipase family protein n=1 Tax=Flavisphingomonas formosensis TaxID=861534 RepID=UPI0012FC1DBC|nr:carboxylesterase family protein [Sphingomonas formosensis]
MAKVPKAIRVLAMLAGLALVGAAPSPGPVVGTASGPVRGLPLEGGTAFEGIPYAAPPVGALRWRPPQPVQPWSAVRDATAFGAACPQPTMPGKAPFAQSEDCLTLNVVAPSGKRRELPVLVVIHGGAFFVGSGREIADQGVSALVKQGIVLVSLNYRLGRLGFFAHPAITGDRNGDQIANYWLMDQIAALKWVKANIARFGGDPDNVTILGCSAGGSSINALVASPEARGLFAKASAHSGGGLFNATRPLAVAERQGLDFAARAGIAGDGPDALARLRALSVEQILAGDPGPPNFGAVIDGTLMPDQIGRLFAQGKQAKVPLLSGSTDNEASIFGLMGFDKKVLADRFGVDVDDLRPAYAGQGTISDPELLRQVQTDFIFTSASVGMSAFAAHGGAPAYHYYFRYVDEAQRGKMAGAPHCADMGYAFDHLKAPTGRDRAVSRMMQSYIVNFVKTGDPNGAGLPAWPRYRAGADWSLVIDDQTAAVRNLRERQLTPWFAKWTKENGISVPR